MTRYDWGQGWSQRRDASGVLTDSSIQPAQFQRSSSSGGAIPGNNFAANPPLSVCRIVTIVHQVPAPQWSDYAAQGLELQTKVLENYSLTIGGTSLLVESAYWVLHLGH